MAHIDTKIVSLTITKGGYNFNAATGGFDLENRNIQHELEHPNDPKTIYGFLTASLKKRRYPPGALIALLHIYFYNFIGKFKNNSALS